MKKDNKNIKLTALASSAALLAAFGTSNVNAAELFDFESLGTGCQLRSNLITADALNAFTSNTDVEFECGEGKCGEGKCGEGKTKESKDDKANAKSDKKKAKSDNSAKVKAEPAKSDKAAKPAKSDSETPKK